MKPLGLRGTAGGWVILLLLGVTGAAFPAPRPAGSIPEDPAPSEHDIKAVFLYNFTRYLEWPEQEQGSGAFDIAVLGDSEILAPLREIAAKKTVRSVPIVIRPCLEIKQIGRPRILFIARSAARWLPQALDELRGAPVLTVGEEEGLARRGVAVNFVLRDGAVKFEMNEQAIRAAGIQPSSQLLKLAILVGGGKPEGGR